MAVPNIKTERESWPDEDGAAASQPQNPERRYGTSSSSNLTPYSFSPINSTMQPKLWEMDKNNRISEEAKQ